MNTLNTEYDITWNKATMGPMPTDANFRFATLAGCKPGSKVALAVAMYNRTDGATTNQITATGMGPHLNKRREIIGRDKYTGKASGMKGFTVYTCVLKGK